MSALFGIVKIIVVDVLLGTSCIEWCKRRIFSNEIEGHRLALQTNDNYHNQEGDKLDVGQH